MKIFEQTKELLGTQITITIVKSDGDLQNINLELVSKLAFEELLRIEKKFSRFLSNSELSETNEKLNEWHEISEEFYTLIQFAVDMRNKSEGAFDVTVQSILDSWGYDENYSFQQKNDGATGKITLKTPNKLFTTAKIDLGGLGKGYALERVAKILTSYTQNFCIDAGGDIYAQGLNQEGKSWKIFFEDPNNPQLMIGETTIDKKYIACSNPVKRSWNNKHHLVSPSAKMPANNMLAVYTQADSGILADGYATALFVMGFEKAKKLLPKIKIEAMLISPTGQIHLSKNFKGTLFT